MTEKKENIESILLDFFEQRAEVLFVYIFGSFVNKKHYNDIDIAVYLKENYLENISTNYSFGYQSELVGKLNGLLKADIIDIVILNKANILLASQIVNKGKLIIDRDKDKRIRIENNIRKEYIDTEHLRQIKFYYTRKKIIEKNAKYRTEKKC